MLISLTVGKVDAGVAVLLTEDKRLIEFPSILLPPSISSGSIVDITVSRNHASENAAQKSFEKLQESIFTTYGQKSPTAPVLRCRNATQTSVVLEWDPIELATADLRSLSLYRNGAKAGKIPRPLEQTSTKLSGLAIDQEFTFHLVLRTSAGVYSSEKLSVRTHKMTDLTGITVTPGPLPPQLRGALATAVERIGGKFNDTVRIDTTHFVTIEGKGKEWERAVENNIPVVRPEWIEGCEREGRIVGVRGYYLNADPKLRQVGQGVGMSSQTQRSNSQASVPKGQQPTSPSAEPSSTHQRADSKPPAPPEKDIGHRTPASGPISPPATGANPSHAEEDLASSPPPEEDEEEDIARARSPQSPLKEEATETTLPDRSKESDEEKEDSDKEVDPGDGSFSEVQL